MEKEKERLGMRKGNKKFHYTCEYLVDVEN